MKSIFNSIIFLLTILITTSCTSFDKDIYFKETVKFNKNVRIAVIPFEDAVNSPKSGINVSDAITNELIRISNWDIVERTQLMKVIKEQSIEATGMTEADYSKLGKLTNVDYFITGSLGQYQQIPDNDGNPGIRITINLRFIDTTHGKIIGTGRYNYNTNKNYLRGCCLTGWFFVFLPEDTIDRELSKMSKILIHDMKEQLKI